MTVASDNPYPSVLLVEGDPEDLADNPSSGQRRLAVGLDHLLYLVDDAGVATVVGDPDALTDPMTTRGDIIVRNASNVTARLARGSAAQVLTSDGTDVGWATPSSGFADPMTTRGDVIVRNASNVTARLAAGTAGQVLTSDGTDVAWQSGSLVRLDEKVASGGATASFDFTSIPSTYRSLQVVLAMRGLQSAAAVGLYLRFNGDTGANYSCGRLIGNGTSSTSDNFAAQTSMQNIAEVVAATGTANFFGGAVLTIPQYKNTTFHKTVTSLGASLSSGTVREIVCSGLWSSTAAINQLTLFLSAGNITDGSVATLYGIN